MEDNVTQGSDYSALTRIEESYCIGDVLIASTAVIGNGVMLRADPGCSITIREGVCLGPDVLIHASQGSIELHQGVCLARGVLIIGQGQLGKQVCIGANSTLINPIFADGTILSSDSLWGDDSRSVIADIPKSSLQDLDAKEDEVEGYTSTTDPWAVSDPWADTDRESKAKADSEPASKPEMKNKSPQPPSASSPSVVIGRQQFEMMVAKMFPDRDAFKQSKI